MKVIVIGCGAAGAAAAIAAAQAGHRVTVLDRNRKPLKKLGVTGNGRGNLLNRGELRYYGDADFALRVLEHMPRPEVEEFLSWLDRFSDANQVKFTITISADVALATDAIKSYF